MKKQIKEYYLPLINHRLLTEYTSRECQCDNCISENVGTDGDECGHDNEYYGCEVVLISREMVKDFRTGIEYPRVTWVFAEDVVTAKSLNYSYC